MAGKYAFPAVVFIFILVSFYKAFSNDFLGRYDSLLLARYAADRIDVTPLLLRASECRTLLQTRSYWHEDYTPGIPFYRPLSLTWFWWQYHVFGIHRFSRWQAVSGCLDLLFCCLFTMTVKNLTGSKPVALCSLIVYAGLRTLPVVFGVLSFFYLGSEPPALIAAYAWKDQPTLLADCLILSAILLAVHKQWAPGLVCAVAAILFKESGWITYALVLMVLAYTGKLRKMPSWVYAATLFSAAVPMLARYSAGMGLIGGEHLGTNRNWLPRYCIAVCGEYLRSCCSSRLPADLLGTSLFAVMRWRTPSLWLRLVAVVASVALAATIAAKECKLSIVTATVLLLDPSLWLEGVVFAALFVAAAYCLVTDAGLFKRALFLLALSLVSGLPFISATQVLAHQLSLCLAFQCAVVGCGWVAVYRVLKGAALRTGSFAATN